MVHLDLCRFHILRQYGRQPAELRYDQQNTARIPAVLFFNRMLLSATFQHAVLSSGPSEATFTTDGPRTAAVRFTGQSPEGLMTTFYPLRFETSLTWRTRSPHLYPPVTGWPGYTPRDWLSFPSPPTTRRSTVEVFNPAFTH
jgi:hypothetical protein